MCANNEHFKTKPCQCIFIIVWAILKVILNAGAIICLSMILLVFDMIGLYDIMVIVTFLAFLALLVDVGFKITLITGLCSGNYPSLRVCFYYGMYELIAESIFLIIIQMYYLPDFNETDTNKIMLYILLAVCYVLLEIFILWLLKTTMTVVNGEDISNDQYKKLESQVVYRPDMFHEDDGSVLLKSAGYPYIDSSNPTNLNVS